MDKDNNVQTKTEERFNLMKKPRAKIDEIDKVHMIYSLENGQSRTDIAREYGVHPHTITCIYRQKEMILQNCSLKYHQLKEVGCMNLDQSLLNWFKVQISNQTSVTEGSLLSKAREITQQLTEEFVYIDDWLLDFRLRHNIIKYSPDIQHSVESLEEWDIFVNNINATDELYVCGTCALSHSFTIDCFATGQLPNDYMSIFYIVHAKGQKKRKIAVVGREQLIAESNIGSLPVSYYCNNGQVNCQAIINYLNEWDTELASEGKPIFLVVNMPDTSYLTNLKFSHIRIIKTNMEFLTKTLDKIAECFKYHYRKLQIYKKIEHGNDLYLGLLDYINMISLAWFEVSNSHVKLIFFPPNEGSLYIKPNDTCDGNHSLMYWCQMYNIPLNLKSYSHCLDQFIWCDKDLPSLDINDETDAYEPHMDPLPSSGMEAYQAMKRLLSYVQGESASEHVLKSAKHLEDHLECGALLEIHKIIDINNSLE